MSRSDFNNDGFDDLAIGVRGQAIGGALGAGGANVLFGSSSRLTATGDEFWSQNSRGVGETAEANDNFSRALASGDFDNDGFDDLAIGAHFEDLAGAANAGAVNVLRGASGGLTAAGDQVWSQNTRGVLGAAESEDHFGESLAVGDFDDDGFDDLAVGAHFKDVGSVANAGAVNVLHGSSDGLTAAGDQFWHQNRSGVLSAAGAEDGFGTALVVGDFDNDGFDDLAAGTPGEDIGAGNAGAVNVLHGSSNGLTAAGDQIWHQNSVDIAGGAEANDNFGEVLAVGDFDSDGFDDLAVGVSGENVGSIGNAGSVNVIHGSSGGLDAAGDQLWDQNSAGVASGAETGDLFGDALAAGDFDNDGFFDLAIGVTGEDVGSATNAGAVSVLYGSSGGLRAAGDQLWHQNSRGVLGVAETNDHFGDALSIGDFNDDGFDDLAIGVTDEGFTGASDAGAVNVLFGSSAGLSASGDQLWHQDVAGVLGRVEADDLFGFSLA